MEASLARLSQEIVAAKTMISRSRRAVWFAPKSLAADKSYGTAPFLVWLLKREVPPYIPVPDRASQTDGKLARDVSTYEADGDSFTCPKGHELTLRSITQETGVMRYKAWGSDGRLCPVKPICTDAPFRSIIRLVDEEARETDCALADTAAFQTARARRKKVEMLFALETTSEAAPPAARGLSGATEEFLLAATAQNLRRLAKLIPA